MTRFKVIWKIHRVSFLRSLGVTQALTPSETLVYLCKCMGVGRGYTFYTQNLSTYSWRRVHGIASTQVRDTVHASFRPSTVGARVRVATPATLVTVAVDVNGGVHRWCGRCAHLQRYSHFSRNERARVLKRSCLEVKKIFFFTLKESRVQVYYNGPRT